MKSLSKLAVLFAMSSLAVSASAQTVVYNNGPVAVPGGDNTYDYVFTIYSDFTFASATTFDQVRFWQIQDPADFSAPSVNWSIFANNAGVRGATLYSGTTTATATADGLAYNYYAQYQEDLSIGSISLAGGTYWLGLQANGNDGRYWRHAVPSGSSTYSDVQNFFGQDNAINEVSYELLSSDNTETTPEPASMVLMASGLFGIGAFARRRVKR